MIRLLFTCALCVGVVVDYTAQELRVERLSWAGVKFRTEHVTVFVDAVGDRWDGNAPEGFVAPSTDNERSSALVTHVRSDDSDVDTLHDVLGERVGSWPTGITSSFIRGTRFGTERSL